MLGGSADYNRHQPGVLIIILTTHIFGIRFVECDAVDVDVWDAGCDVRCVGCDVLEGMCGLQCVSDAICGARCIGCEVWDSMCGV